MRLAVFEAGHTVHPERIVLGDGPFAPMRFPNLFAALQHPRHGVVLYDTGYGERFRHATRRFPERLHAWVTPLHQAPHETALARLRAEGITATDVRHVVVSHFHADHVAGLADFPKATVHFWGPGLAAVRRLSRLTALRKGFLPALLPHDLDRRARPLHPRHLVPVSGLPPFGVGADVLGDGSAWAIPLPGHATGHLGLWVPGAGALLVGDAVWTTASLRERRLPHPIARLVLDDWPTYAHTVDRLRALRGVDLLPSHCDAVCAARAGRWTPA